MTDQNNQNDTQNKEDNTKNQSSQNNDPAYAYFINSAVASGGVKAVDGSNNIFQFTDASQSAQPTNRDSANK
jgi:hypothetical protein